MTARKNEGIATANLFLNHGTITYLQGQKYPKQTFNADPQKAVATNLPLVVLVNRGTAGPAEIVAAAVMENARGDVLGDKTFGSGSIQKVIDMPDGSALMLSVAKYYSPSGKAVQDTAITPNILVADTNDDFIAPDEDENAPDDDAAGEAEGQSARRSAERAIEVLKGQGRKHRCRRLRHDPDSHGMKTCLELFICYKRHGNRDRSLRVGFAGETLLLAVHYEAAPT